MSKATGPRGRDPNGLAGKLLQFFADNPDEELTPEQVATKFGYATGYVYTRLWEMQKRGEIDFERVARAKS